MDGGCSFPNDFSGAGFWVYCAIVAAIQKPPIKPSPRQGAPPVYRRIAYRLRHFRGSLRVRMILAISALLIAATATTGTYLARQIISQQLDSQRKTGQGLLNQAGPAVRVALASETAGALAANLGKIAMDPAVANLRVLDGDGISLYEHKGEQEPANWFIQLLAGEHRPPTLTSEFNLRGDEYGRIELGLSYQSFNRTVNQLALRVGLFFALVLAASMILTYALLTRLIAPLKPLTELANQFARGNWAAKITLMESGTHEIQQLNQALAQGSATMLHYIRNHEETRELLEYNEHRLRTLVNSMHEILFELDADGRITFLNPAWQQLTGFPIDEAMGRPFTDFLIDEDVIDDFDLEFLGELREKNRELRMRTADARGLWASLDADAHHDGSGRFTGVIGTLNDITQSIELNTLIARYQDDLYFLSVTDPLTNLYNRRHFDNKLDIVLAERLPLGQSVCLLIIDLDGFKFINDTYGHPAGDQALRTIAKLLQTTMREDDYLARLAGDEFAMVLIDTNLKTAALIAAKLHASINETHIELPIGHIQLRCSIGVAEAPLHGRTLQELVSAADVALYQSKRQGRNRVEVLSAGTSQSVMTIFNQGFQLRNALQDGGLMPAFQPICDMRTGQPVAYEALARMRINNNTIQAAEFIGVAEELGLTREIDLHIIEQSLRLAPIGYDLFLNLDPSSFNDRDFAKQLTRLLSPACRGGRAITIEITERENVIITDALLADIGELRKLGCKLALDDFGSGYSTYQFLNLFRPEYLKIEGAFVRGMLDNEADRKIVEHIHDLAVAFGISTIAESVENEDTCLALLDMGIHNAQGFHLGSPELHHL